MAATYYTAVGTQKVIDLETLKPRYYSVSISRDGIGYMVRKTELIGLIRIPLFESYVLGIEDAIKLQEQLVNQLYNNQLN
jgi:hypothetical protein